MLQILHSAQQEITLVCRSRDSRGRCDETSAGVRFSNDVSDDQLGRLDKRHDDDDDNDDDEDDDDNDAFRKKHVGCGFAACRRSCH